MPSDSLAPNWLARWPRSRLDPYAAIVADVELGSSETRPRVRHRRGTWWVTFALIAAAALGGAGWVLTADPGRSAGHPSLPTYGGKDVPPGPPPTNPAEAAAEQRVYVVTEQLQGLTERDVAYESMALAPPKLIIYVYRTTARSSVSEHDYRALVPADIALQFLPALMSYTQEGQLTDLVKARTQWLTDHGVEISFFGGGGRGGPYEIGYAEHNPPDNSLLQPFEIFGPGTVVFQYQARATW